MRTAELPVGTHVAYNRGSRSYPNFVEAYVVTHRPKGNRTSYWGNNGNHNTIGITYKPSWAKPGDAWYTEWVRPAQLEMLWDEYAETVVAAEKRQAEREAAAKRAKIDRGRRMDAIPAEVKALFSDYQIEYMIKGHNPSVSFTVDFLEKLVAAAQAAHPKVKAATVEEEVAAALALLG